MWSSAYPGELQRAQFLGDVPAATAILDCFLQHVEIILKQGRSYRLGVRRAAPREDHNA